MISEWYNISLLWFAIYLAGMVFPILIFGGENILLLIMIYSISWAISLFVVILILSFTPRMDVILGGLFNE